MTIYDFVNSITDSDNIIYTLFDCNTEDLISFCTEDAENTYDLNVNDILYSEYVDYEIGGTDIWIDNGKIHIEFNISVE